MYRSPGSARSSPVSAAREGRNPQTGETMQIAATTVPGFKAAAAFKQATAK